MEIHRVIRLRGSQRSRVESADNTFYYNIAGIYYSMASLECWVLRTKSENLMDINASAQARKWTKNRRGEPSDSRNFQLHKPVPEINFLLNFGAALCPPITVYYADSVHRQIQSIASHFLEVSDLVDCGSTELNGIPGQHQSERLIQGDLDITFGVPMLQRVWSDSQTCGSLLI